MSKFLIVDDDSLSRGAIELALASEGHTLQHASNGLRGLAVLAAQLSRNSRKLSARYGKQSPSNHTMLVIA